MVEGMASTFTRDLPIETSFSLFMVVSGDGLLVLLLAFQSFCLCVCARWTTHTGILH